MNAPRPTTRFPRGRIVVVNDRPLLERMDGLVQRPSEHADSPFDAIGMIAASTARAPVTAVVIAVDAMGASPNATLDAFRRLDPSIRLVLTAPAAEEQLARTAVDAGFDGYVLEPVSIETLSRLVDGHAVESIEPVGETDLAEPQDGGETTDVPTIQITEPLSPPPPTTASPEAPPEVAPEVTPEMPPEAVGELGDVDLLDCILNAPAHLTDMALTLIMQETGWNDLRLVEDRDGDDSAIAVAVSLDDEWFGSLTSDQASERELRQWAAWLAPWLAVKREQQTLRELAYRDPLTGAYNRRYFDHFLADTLADAKRRRRAIPLMLLDVDDLKKFNDKYGHAAGDEILCETVRLLQSVIRRGDRVCRIGGDEFAVVFADPAPARKPGSMPPETVERIAGRFQAQISQLKFPKLGPDAPGRLSVSAGLATFPWDGADADSLLRHADQLAIESKRRGKNALTLGPGADRPPSFPIDQEPGTPE